MALRKLGSLLTLLAVFALVVPVTEAQTRRRLSTRSFGTLSGTITDSESGEAIFDGQVWVGFVAFVANKDGQYRTKDIPAGPVMIRVSRWGYFPQTHKVQLEAGENTFNVSLAPKPVAWLTDLSGLTYRVDRETMSIDAWFPLALPTRLDPLVLCTADGGTREVLLKDVKTMNGPGVVAPLPGCARWGDPVRVNLTLRSGEVVEGYFPEGNYYLVVLRALDRDDGRAHYLRLTEIESLEIP